MSDINIGIPAGKKKRLLTGGKYCPDDIVVEAVGGAPVEEKDVNFYDYDGTLLHSYTLAEVQEMSELPPLPTQPGLTCQGWNWTLEGIKEQGKTDVGAIYITDDGKTRVVVEITDIVSPMIYLNWVGATVNIDWGDGSELEMSVPAGNHQHEYQGVGEYEITLEVVSGTLNPTYNNTSWAFVGNNLACERSKLKRVYFGRNIESNFAWLGLINSFCVTEITLPEGITKIASSAFSNCRRLGYIGLPKSVTWIDGNAIQYCPNLRKISLPESIETIGNNSIANNASLNSCIVPRKTTSMGTGIFNASAIEPVSFPESVITIPNQCCDNCEKLLEVEMSNSIVTIGSYAFRNCKCLSSIEIHVNVETIRQNAFANCEALKKIKFLPATPPTVENANAFTGIPSTCVVEVPVGTLAAYQAATNYAAIAAQMVEVEA